MKILQINNHHKLVGGAERYYLELSDLLVHNGHEVAFFSTKSPKNFETRWRKYFVDEIDFKINEIKDFPKKILRIIYSIESRKKIGKLLDDFKPDIVHIHNIYYYISPSILIEIKKRGIPIVQTVHDYQLISPNVTLFSDGKINEKTKTKRYYNAFINKSVKGKYSASFVATVASYFQDIFKLYQKNVDLFIAPSNFIKNKLIEYGFSEKKIIQLNNFVNIPKMVNHTDTGKYIFYFGRVNEAKGIFLLLDAVLRLPNIKFKVAGNFEDERIKSVIFKKIKTDNIKNIEFLGYKSGGEINNLILKSRFVVVPSLWYENQPYSVLESFALGKTVVGSGIGGIIEMISDGKNGLLFEPGNIGDFVQKIKRLWGNPALVNKLGGKAKELVNEKFNSEIHYNKVIEIYNKVLIQKF